LNGGILAKNTYKNKGRKISRPKKSNRLSFARPILNNASRLGGFLMITSIKSSSMIKLQVIGNLGKDCITNTVNGKNVINFNVAHTEKFRDAQGNQKDKTTWVECAYWTDRTGIAPYLKKGTQVYVEGTPEVRTYPKNDGTTGVSLSLRVVSVQLLGSRPSSELAGGSTGGYSAQPATGSVPSPNDITAPIDDLPF
jgi:single-strand DNA-binding protein